MPTCEKGGRGTRGWHPCGREHPQSHMVKEWITPKKIVTLYMPILTRLPTFPSLKFRSQSSLIKNIMNMSG